MQKRQRQQDPNDDPQSQRQRRTSYGAKLRRNAPPRHNNARKLMDLYYNMNTGYLEEQDNNTYISTLPPHSSESVREYTAFYHPAIFDDDDTRHYWSDPDFIRSPVTGPNLTDITSSPQHYTKHKREMTLQHYNRNTYAMQLYPQTNPPFKIDS